MWHKVFSRNFQTLSFLFMIDSRDKARYQRGLKAHICGFKLATKVVARMRIWYLYFIIFIASHIPQALLHFYFYK